MFTFNRRRKKYTLLGYAHWI